MSKALEVLTGDFAAVASPRWYEVRKDMQQALLPIYYNNFGIPLHKIELRFVEAYSSAEKRYEDALHGRGSQDETPRVDISGTSDPTARRALLIEGRGQKLLQVDAELAAMHERFLPRLPGLCQKCENGVIRRNGGIDFCKCPAGHKAQDAYERFRMWQNA